MRQLYTTIFLPRQLGFSLAVILTFAYHHPGIDWFLLGVCLVGLIYPAVANLIQRWWFPSNHLARKSMALDAVFVALLIAFNDFNFSIATTLICHLLFCTAIISGVRGVLVVMGVCGTTLLIASRLIVVEAALNNLVVEWLALVGLLFFTSFVAWQVFHKTRWLESARRNTKMHLQDLQFQSEQLGRYISPQLRASMQHKIPVGVTQRRRLTLCFTDLSGFTELMDRLPEHEMTLLLNEYLDAMAKVALEHGATIDKFMGDGMMLFFGDPRSLGPRKDAEACVTMALAMSKRLDELTAEWHLKGFVHPLQMRIGIHSGYCAVGNFGAESRVDYTAIGGAVNTASRLEGHAPNGKILISGETAKLTSGLFRLGELRKVKLKGLREPVSYYEVLKQNLSDKMTSPVSPVQLLR